MFYSFCENFLTDLFVCSSFVVYCLTLFIVLSVVFVVVGLVCLVLMLEYCTDKIF